VFVRVLGGVVAGAVGCRRGRTRRR
jgi:hypothetical protein